MVGESEESLPASGENDLPDIVDLVMEMGRPEARVPAHVEDLVETAREDAENASSQNTRDAYARDWKHFSSWCRRNGFAPLPPDSKASRVRDRPGQSTVKILAVAVRYIERVSRHLPGAFVALSDPLQLPAHISFLRARALYDHQMELANKTAPCLDRPLPCPAGSPGCGGQVFAGDDSTSSSTASAVFRLSTADAS